MSRKFRVIVVFGTRPEAVKLAPVIESLRTVNHFEVTVVVTAQHREMLDQVLETFRIIPDIDLNLMQNNQSIAHFTALAVQKLDAIYASTSPDLVLVQGDTSSVVAASLSAFYRRIHVGHVEAGLRTFNLSSPWPEEGNRKVTTQVTALHFAPTETNRSNLIKEGVTPERIHVTGSTSVDALHIIRKNLQLMRPLLTEVSEEELAAGNIVLITAHRRESFGEGFKNICQGIRVLAARYPNMLFVYPVHMNPCVRDIVAKELGGTAYENVRLIRPLSYVEFVRVMLRSKLVLTDSGGVQEEGPSLGIPVFIMRDTTERPEAIDSGCSRLVGTNPEKIVREVSNAIDNNEVYRRMVLSNNPYGDGKAAERITTACANFLFEEFVS